MGNVSIDREIQLGVQVDQALSEGYVCIVESEYEGRNRSCSRLLQQLYNEMIVAVTKVVMLRNV